MQVAKTLARVVARGDLSQLEAQETLDAIFRGELTSVQVAGLLIGMRMKGETAAELAGFAQSMRKHSERVIVKRDGRLLDTCGTGGGEGAVTFNISTVAAFVAAGAGVTVAKHGNRAITSKCGSADLLEALGARAVLRSNDAARAIEEIGIGFLFAPAFHPAMRTVQPVRQELGVRTVFNLLGPLTNPAGADAQLIGAPSVHYAALMAEALVRLGLEHGLVVHGEGLDEVTTTGITKAFRVSHGGVEQLTLSPEDFGIARASVEDLAGGDAPCNAEIARSILGGAKGPMRDVVVVNASAALVACGRAENWRAGVALSAHSIDSGSAARRLRDYVDFTQSLPE
jgi:anthranilate phosphoribosyltransferase